MYTGTTFSSFLLTILCASTPAKTPLPVAASHQRYFSAVSSMRLQKRGSRVSISLILSKASTCFCVYLNSALELVKGVSTPTCSITFMLTTLRKLFTSPKNALTDFLFVGKANSLTFCTRRGSAITKLCETNHPRKRIFVLLKSHFVTLILAP